MMGTLAKNDDNINAETYIDILVDNVWPVIIAIFSTIIIFSRTIVPRYSELL